MMQKNMKNNVCVCIYMCVCVYIYIDIKQSLCCTVEKMILHCKSTILHSNRLKKKKNSTFCF